ncbi:putative mediator of RNA polymerase II transcription subunit 22 [[Candida] jaroonii]|uniref:Mediator of RNA polymerase II transcription subunit 22 n=1 Tax=[Candida] jaroonii TaxID=467808 RepID=A0ACA9YDU1_9ASCO|nr:putative mediator of RNA polymerase II transcription subunit 22 [[Candida] jaroonii]
MQPRSIALLENIDSIVENLLQKFQDIFDVGVIQDKSKELLAIESLAIETDALSIIKFCEELLTITKGLRESWCLDSIKVNPVENKQLEQEEINYIFGKFNQLTDKIAEIK